MAPQIRGTAAAETTLETAASKPVTTAPKAIDTEEVYDLTQALTPVATKPSAAFTGLASQIVMAPQIRGTAATETTLETAAPEPVTTAPEAVDTEEVYDLTQALPPVAKKPSAAFTSLARLLPTRRPELRRAKQDEVRPARGVPNLSRMSNREATVAQSVGAPAPSPCGLCAKGGGLWTSCVVVAGFLRGSCANCHYGGNGFKCTFRQAAPSAPTAATPAAAAAAAAVPTSSGPGIGPISSVAAFARLIERDPVVSTRQIRQAPPSPTTEFSQWVGFFRAVSPAGRRAERNRLRRLRAALETACEEEEDYEEED